MNKKYVIICYTLSILTMACSSGDDGGGLSGKSVVINNNGNTSDGSRFTALDDKSFYLDYIKYSVKNGHLSVTGFDKQGFKGVASIYSNITYKGNSYEVLEIGGDAFTLCKTLTAVTLPINLKKINSHAFGSCENITSIRIPSSVEYIGQGIFYDCKKLTSIIVDNNNKTYDSRDNCNAIIETSSSKLISGCNNTKIPNSIMSLASYAFSGCADLKDITIPNCETIEERVFYLCSGLSSITIPNSVLYISESAFNGCSSLTTLTLGSSVENIDYAAFDGCGNISTIHCLCSNPPSLYNSFDFRTYAKATVYVPKGSLDKYQKSSGWKNFRNIVEE